MNCEYENKMDKEFFFRLHCIRCLSSSSRKEQKNISCSFIHFCSVCYSLFPFILFPWCCFCCCLSFELINVWNGTFESKIYTRITMRHFFLSFCANALISIYRNTYVNGGKKHESMMMLAISIISLDIFFYFIFSLPFARFFLLSLSLRLSRRNIYETQFFFHFISSLAWHSYSHLLSIPSVTHQSSAHFKIKWQNVLIIPFRFV